MTKPIYLDYASTTPVNPKVKEAMLPFLQEIFGNPSSKNYYGCEAKRAIENARSQVSASINCNSDNIFWTSGASEANNLAIKGAAYFYKRQGQHIITSEIEHKSVLATYRYLETIGFKISYLPTDSNGIVNIEYLKKIVRPDTILVSIMHINNEIGSVQDIEKIGEFTRSHGIVFHVDAAQSIGKIPLDFKKLKIDLASFSSHKAYGPKGIGALYIRSKPRIHLTPQIHGGDQENGIRAGTLPTHQIVGMGEAFHLASLKIHEENKRISQLRSKLWDGIKDLDNIHLNSSPSCCVANIINISFTNINSELLMAALKDIAISQASACIKNTHESHVLKAIGIPNKLALNTIRISLGAFTTEKEIAFTVQHIKNVITTLTKK